MLAILSACPFMNLRGRCCPPTEVLFEQIKTSSRIGQLLLRVTDNGCKFLIRHTISPRARPRHIDLRLVVVGLISCYRMETRNYVGAPRRLADRRSLAPCRQRNRRTACRRPCIVTAFPDTVQLAEAG